MTQPSVIVGLGEVLWDLLPSGRQLGGAPANFAYCSHLLGNDGVIASRIGNDELGRELGATLALRGLACNWLQVDSDQPTGTVHVELSAEGQPNFQITQPAAWDFLTFYRQLEDTGGFSRRDLLRIAGAALAAFKTNHPALSRLHSATGFADLRPQPEAVLLLS